MEGDHTGHLHEPWNKGKLIGQEAPFKLKEIWAIRVRLQTQRRLVRYLGIEVDDALEIAEQTEVRERVTNTPYDRNAPGLRQALAAMSSRSTVVTDSQTYDPLRPGDIVDRACSVVRSGGCSSATLEARAPWV